MADTTCELAGMVCFYSNDRNCFEECKPRQCTWCNKHVCHHHSHNKLTTTACDECVVLDKTIVLNGEIRHARGRKKPDESSEYFTQYYSGLYTKSAK